MPLRALDGVNDFFLPDASDANDASLIRRVLSGSEYRLPPAVLDEPLDLVIDVGANVGAFSVCLAREHQCRRIICVEPSPICRPVLEVNSRPYPCIEVYPVGLWRQSGEGRLYLGSSKAGLADSIKRNRLSTDEETVIPLKDAREFLLSLGSPHVAILKLDTEGCEVEILERLRSFFPNIDLILFEFHSEDDRRRIDAILSPEFILYYASVDVPHRGTCGYLNRRLEKKGNFQVRAIRSLPEECSIGDHQNVENESATLENAEKLLEGQLIHEARTVLIKGLDRYPDSPSILNDLGIVELALDRFRVAKALFRLALRREPDFLSARENLQGILRLEKQYLEKSGAVSLPRLIMIMVVRDEADIIRWNIMFHRMVGVDHFIIMDNGSVDGTREILEELSLDGDLRILDEPSHTIDQDLWMTQLIGIAQKELDGGWVVLNDADEFWLPRLGNLKSEIDGQATVLNCRRVNVLPRYRHSASPTAEFFQSVFNIEKPIEGLEHASAAEGSLPGPILFCRIGRKVMCALNGLESVGFGNHNVVYRDPRAADSANVLIYHYPVRSYEQFNRKVVNYGRSLLNNPRHPMSRSWHLRRWFDQYQNGKLETEYDSFFLDQSLSEIFIKEERIRADHSVWATLSPETLRIDV